MDSMPRQARIDAPGALHHIASRLEFLQTEKNATITASAKNKYQKEIDNLKKKQVELSKFDDELRHYADMKISLDLDGLLIPKERL